MNRILTSLVLLSSVCLVRGQLVQNSPAAGSRYEPIPVDWPELVALATNRPATAEAIAQRAAFISDWAAHTNGGSLDSGRLEVRSAARGAGAPPQARWEVGPGGGFRAEQAAFEATLAEDLFVQGALTVAIPGQDGTTSLRGTVLALAYCEPGDGGEWAVIAWSKPTRGQLERADRVVFRDAFAGAVADVVFDLTRYSVSQDVVVRGRLPGPEVYGLSGEAHLAVITEFTDSPGPLALAAPDGREPVLRWGRMGMVQGKAFRLGDGTGEPVDVQKSWGQIEGRSLLFESVPYGRVKGHVETLPLLESPGWEAPESGEGARTLPQPPASLVAGRLEELPFGDPSHGLLAGLPWAAAGEEPGFVMDYILTLPVPVINIDFGFGAQKTGFAAVGQSANDVWNSYDILGNGTLTDLQWSDAYQWGYGHNSYASVSLSNALGRWGFPAPIDPMYDVYHYPWWGAMTGTLNSLPSGTYDIYVYGHGPSENGNSVITLEGVTKSTASVGDYWHTADWQEGHQYVVFRGVTVAGGQTLFFTVAPGVSGYALLNGMQIVPTGQLPAPPVVYLDPASAVTVPPDGAITFRCAAYGPAPLHYQWRKNGVNIAGATGATLTLLGVQAGDAGSYSVAVSNPGGTTLSGGIGLSVTGGGCLPPPSGLVAWWPADGTDYDQGIRHPAVRVNGAGFAPAIVNAGFSLNGISAYVQVPADADLDVGLGAGFTFESWIEAADPTGRPIFEWGTPSQLGVHVWANYPAPGAVTANFIDRAGGSHAASQYNVLGAGAPAHVAVTYDRASGNMRFVINGLQRLEWPLGSFELRTQDPFYLGHRPQAAAPAWFHGTIDEAALYSRALSTAEIAGLYRAGLNGKCRLDSEEDALPDAWEWEHFGDLSQAGSGDYDGDGITNAQEYQAGTNPLVEGGSLQVFTPLQ